MVCPQPKCAKTRLSAFVATENNHENISQHIVKIVFLHQNNVKFFYENRHHHSIARNA